MVVSQPTRGVDVGATEYIHQQMLEMREQGTAILLISADLDEIRSLSDQIGVLYQGRLVALKRAEAYTDQEIGLLMAGMGAAGGASTPGHPGEAAGPQGQGV